MEFETFNNQFIFKELGFTEEEIEILTQNGFDDEESLRLVDKETLQQLGIQNSQQYIDAIQCYFEINENQKKFIDEQQLGHILKESTVQNKQCVQVKEKSITKKLIISTLQNKSLTQYQQDQQLPKLTHLQLNGKKIQKIEFLENCPNLKVLYLQDNLISKIEGLQNLNQLIQLSLYNNNIRKIEGLESLTSLRKLYLEKNRISRLEGLIKCGSLEELYLSNQQLQGNQEFTFDEYSLAAISSTLKYLDISSSNVKQCKSLYFLENLEVLNLKNNRIEDFEQEVYPLLQTTIRLKKIDLTDNPITNIPKYRDQIVLVTRSLEELDNKKITQQERQYLMTLVQRKQLKSQQKPITKPIKSSTQQKQIFEVQGKNKMIHHINDQEENEDDNEDTQNQFYSPIDCEMKTVFKPKITQNVKKRSTNINTNNDFTVAGASHVSTKHIPKANIIKK